MTADDDGLIPTSSEKQAIRNYCDAERATLGPLRSGECECRYPACSCWGMLAALRFEQKEAA